jgi:hypothetical protein
MDIAKLTKKSVLGAIALCCAAAAHGDVLRGGNKSAHTLWAIDLASGERRASFETGNSPHEVAVAPGGQFAVVSNYGDRAEAGNSLTVVDVSAGRVVRTIDLGQDTRPHGVAFRPDGVRTSPPAPSRKSTSTRGRCWAWCVPVAAPKAWR